MNDRGRHSNIAVAIATVVVALAVGSTGQAAGADPEPATISGVVTSEGAPLQGVDIQLFDMGDLIDSTVTAVDGSYMFDGVLPVHYVVHASAASAVGNYVPEYYDNSITYPSATSVLANPAHSPADVDFDLAPSVCFPPDPGPFPDVPPSNPFCLDIEWLSMGGITLGFSDGNFRPVGDITRQAMAAFTYRYMGSPGFPPPATPTFPDVPPTHPFYLEIEWLASTGITTGFADGTFRPGAKITRQAVAAFYYRLAESPTFDPPAVPTFPDVGMSNPFYAEIEWLATTDITTGFLDGTFRPVGLTTRQAMAAFFHRFDDQAPGFFG